MNTRRFRPPTLVLGLAAALALPLLAACGEQAGAESCKGAQVKAGIVSSLSDSLLFIAEDKGYFKQEGLKVKLVKFDSGAKMIPALGSGQLDVGAGAPSAGFYNAVARDISLKVVADKGRLVKNYDYMPILVRKDLVESGKVKSVADLKGLKVAEPAEGTSTAATLAAVLKTAGLSYDDVKHEYLAFPDHIAGFTNGSIDASATVEPAASKLIADGTAVRFFDSTKTYNQQQLAVLLYGSQFAEERKAAAQCFMNAYVKAAADYSAAVEGGKWSGPGVDEIANIIGKSIGLDPEAVKKTVPSYVAPDAKVDTDSLQKDYDFFDKSGWLEGQKGFQVTDIVDNSFVEKASETGN